MRTPNLCKYCDEEIYFDHTDPELSEQWVFCCVTCEEAYNAEEENCDD